MNISPNSPNINTYTDFGMNQNIIQQNAQTNAAYNNVSLPSSHSVGQSLLNNNMPVSYTKIADIDVPGVKDKASLFKLANGQKVVILPKKGPTYVRTSYNVGSLNEPDDLRGISHFIEHNLFNGSKDYKAGEYDKQVTKLGGYTNAFTSFDETQYYLNLQLLEDNSLEEAIKLNANLTQFPTFPVEQLEKEKEPVKQEIDMCADIVSNKPYSTMLKNMFSISSSSDDLVIGTKDNINALTREKVLDYYNTWYTPDNAVTVITGDVDVNETIGLVSKYFNKKPDTSKINQRKYEPLIPVNKPIRTDVKQSTDPNAFITMGFPIEAGTSQRELDKLNVLLGFISSRSSNISKKLDKYGLQADFGILKLSSAPDGAKVISADISLPEEQTEEVLKIIYDGIIDLANNPPDEQTLREIINPIIKGKENIAEYSSDISSELINIVKRNDLNYFADSTAAISSLTPQDISLLARKYLDLNKISICVAHPEQTSNEEIIQNHRNINAQNKPISFGKSINVAQSLAEEVNKIQEFRLPNNMEVSIFPTENPSTVSMYLEINGNYNDSASKSAVMVLSKLLQNGSLFKDNVTMDKLQRQLNLTTRISASSDSIGISANIDTNKINESLDLIKENLLYPNFTQEKFDNAKQILKDILLNSKASPYDKLEQELHPNSMYYADKKAQLEALDKLTLADIQQLYASILNNGQAKVAIAAPINQHPEITSAFANKLSTDLPMFKPFVKDIEYNTNIYRPNTTEKILTAVENNAQASIVQSYQYKNTGNIDDTAKIKLMNIILGSGGMSSRLFNDLRNNEKLAYSVGSSLDSCHDMGSIDLFIETSTDPDITPEASPENITKSLNGFKRNIEKLKTQNVSDEELQSAKVQLKSSILDLLESSDSKTDIGSKGLESRYGKEYYSKLLEAIDKITVDDIRAAANYVFKDAPITSIVASQKTIDSLNL